MDEAEQILRRAARCSKVYLPEPILKHSRGIEEVRPLTGTQNKMTDGYDTFQGGGPQQKLHDDVLPEDQVNGLQENPSTEKVTMVNVKATPQQQNDAFSQLQRMAGFKNQKKPLSYKDNYTCIDIIKSKKLLLYTFIMCSLW